MQPSYNAWGRMGAVQYTASAGSRVLTTDHTINFVPFERGVGSKEQLVHTLHRNLWCAYESIWRMTQARGSIAHWFDVESRAAIPQRVAAFWLEDLCVGIDSAPDYWVRNAARLFAVSAQGWDRVARLRSATHIPLVIRLRPGRTFDTRLIPVYNMLWRALGFVDTTPTHASGNALWVNTSNLPAGTLREQGAWLRALPAVFRARMALHNDNLSAHAFARLCSVLRIRGSLNVGTARDGHGARVTQSSTLFETLRTGWTADLHATIRVAPGWVVFLNEPVDADPDVVDRFIRHFGRIDTAPGRLAPHVVLTPPSS